MPSLYFSTGCGFMIPGLLTCLAGDLTCGLANLYGRGLEDLRKLNPSNYAMGRWDFPRKDYAFIWINVGKTTGLHWYENESILVIAQS